MSIPESDRRSVGGTVRFINDSIGRRWTVRETNSMAYDRRSRPSLIFDTDGLMRRVYSYPPDWYEWSDEDLLALSLGY